MNSETLIYSGQTVADAWEKWCGETHWSKTARAFGEQGGMIQWFCGFPQSASAIPLCFTCLLPDGTRLDGHSRLKDLRQAVKIITGEQ